MHTVLHYYTATPRGLSPSIIEHDKSSPSPLPPRPAPLAYIDAMPTVRTVRI
jgi:hypothetical protein